jgi:hypothetical protein
MRFNFDSNAGRSTRPRWGRRREEKAVPPVSLRRPRDDKRKRRGNLALKRRCRKARKREKEDERVLFPVRLVSYEAMQSWEYIDSSGKDLAEEIRQYFIPDFRRWKGGRNMIRIRRRWEAGGGFESGKLVVSWRLSVVSKIGSLGYAS